MRTAAIPTGPARGEHFLPLRPGELIARLADDPAVTIFEREQFRQLCQLLAATIHHEYHARLEALKAAYAPFDPDADAIPLAPAAEPARERARCGELFAQFDDLLARANYRRLSRQELEAAIRAPNRSGLRFSLDLALFERLEIYVRGACELSRTTRSWRTGWRDVVEPLAAYRRLAIIFRLRERLPGGEPLPPRAVVLKLFKDIPQAEIETLLPGGQVRIGWWEQAKIAVPTASGLALALLKLLKGAAGVAVASAASLVAFLSLVGGALGYAVRSFHSYLRAREKHQLSLTRHLYFQNLDNNAGVLYHLLAEAEEQELREVVLAWWLLWRGGLAGATPSQIDAAAERWLAEHCGLAADFEIADALAKLERLGLAHPRQAAEGSRRPPVAAPAAGHASAARWHPVSVEEALAALDRAWDALYHFEQPATIPLPAARVVPRRRAA